MLSKPLKIALSVFNSFEKLYCTLFHKKKMARTRGGLNNLARLRRDYFENRRFAAQKEIQQRRNARFKIKKVIPQRRVIQVKKHGNIVRTMNVRRCAIYPATKRLIEY